MTSLGGLRLNIHRRVRVEDSSLDARNDRSDDEITFVDRVLDPVIRKNHANRSDSEGTLATLGPSNVRRGKATIPNSPFCSTTSTGIASSLAEKCFTKSDEMKDESLLPSIVVMPMATSLSNIPGRTSQLNHAFFFKFPPLLPDRILQASDETQAY